MSEPTDLIRAVDEVHKPIRPKFFDEGELVCEDCGDLWPCEVRRLRDALDASDAELDGVGQALADAEIRVNHFRAYAEDVASHGMRADLNPTLGRVMTADETVGWAYSYLRRVDAWVRGAANRTLDTDPGDSGLPPLPPEHRFLNLNPYSQKPSDTEAALAEANATIQRLKREVNMIAAHRTDWDNNGPDHDEWLASLGEKRLDGPDMAYRGIQYAVTRLRRAIEGSDRGARKQEKEQIE